MMARISRKVFATPSPCFAVNYNGNTYDASNGLDPNRSGCLLRLHGAASHRFKARAGAVGAVLRHVR